MAKGASGQSIDELSVSIGLDLDKLRLDFDTAGMTVRQAISRLNSENTQIKLKADISSLNAAGNAVEQEKIKMESLTKQVEIQTQKLKLLEAARDGAMKSHGADSSVTRGAETSYLKQQKYVAQLNAELSKLRENANNAGNTANGTMSKIQAGAQKARDGVSSVTGAYGTLSGKLAAVMAVATTGAGLFNITDKAMQAGENVYKLSQRLHLTASEASSLSRVFSISGVSIEGIIPYFSQLDKSVLESGKGLNTTSMSLMKFGVNLKDSSGNLLPINQQLDQLAKGYQKAVAAGKEEEFQAQVLGRRGAELIPLLENYNDNMKIASSIKTTGLLDPKEAHELSLEWRAMKAEAGQLQLAFGSAMIPIAKEVMPEVTDGTKELVEYIKSNKDDIKGAIKGWGAALAEFGKIAGEVAVAVGKLGDGMSSNRDDKILADNIADYNANKDRLTSGVGMFGAGLGAVALGAGATALTGGLGAIPLGAAALGGLLGYESYGGYEGRKYRNDQIATHANDYANWAENYHLGQVTAGKEKYTQFEQTAADALNGNLDTSKWDKYAGAIDNTSQKLKDLTGVDTDFRNNEQQSKQATDENAEAQLKAAKAMEWRASVAGQLSEKIYSLTHNDIENAQHSMWVEVEKAQANGVPQDLIDRFVNAQSARIAEDKFRNVTAPMAEAFKTDLQNQLDQVDLQAKSYIRAGATQEEADAWAEQRKSKINADWDREVASQIDSIWKSSFQNRLDEIDREKEAWKQKGLDEVKATEWAEEKKRETYEETAQSMFSSQLKYYRAWMKGGQEGIMRQMRREMHIPANAMTSPEEIANFQNAMKYAKNNLIPIVPNDQLIAARQAAMGGGNNIEVLRGAMNSATSGLTSSLTGALQPLVTAINNGAGKMFEVHAQPTSYSPNITINTNLSDAVMTNDIVDLIADRTATKVNSALQPMKDNYYDNKYGV